MKGKNPYPPRVVVVNGVRVVDHRAYRKSRVKKAPPPLKGRYRAVELPYEEWERRRKARQKVRDERVAGRLVAGPCARAGADCKGIVEAHHHRGYSPERWLDVIWVCRRHHRTVHREERQRRSAPEGRSNYATQTQPVGENTKAGQMPANASCALSRTSK